MVDALSSLPAGLPTNPALLTTLLDLLPMGVIYYTPVVDAAGTLTDLALAYLNPAAQRMTQLPARPATTYRQQFPTTDANGAWDFHRRSWLGPEPGQFQFYYDADGFDAYFRVTAQRLGEGLLSIFTDTQDEVRSLAEQALLASQMAEQAARAEAEAQRLRLHQVLMRIPAHIALLRSPEHIFDLVNPEYEKLFPDRVVLGHSIREVIPELEGQGFYELFDRVYQTGKPYYESEAEALANFAGTGELQRRYFRTAFEPIRNARGEVTEVLNFAVDVTEQVEARYRIENLNQLAQTAQAEAERQRGELQRVFEQAPVAIAVYRGPTYTIQLANPTVARLWGRTQEQLLGKDLFEALPEVAGLGYEQLLDGVMATGVPHVAHAMEAQHDRNGHRETVYWDFVYVPTYAADGHIDGAMVVATEVTAQVLARQQVQQLNEQLTATNADLQASNADYVAVNAALHAAQQQLRQLNAELEVRVQERTAQLTEQQGLLAQILRQVPAAIATLSGPAHHFSFANARYQDLVGHRVAVGQTVAEVLPEVVEQGVIELLDRVYQTGEPFLGREIMIMLERPPGPPHHYHYDLTYLALRDGQGAVQGILVFAVEVSEQVKARRQVQRLNQELAASNAELAQSNARLTRVNADLDTFVYTASHDLKAPITNIEGLLLALREVLPADVGQQAVTAQLLAMLDDTVSRFRFTITQLTDLVRLQQSQDGPSEPIEFRPLIAAVCQDLTPEIRAAQATVHVEVLANAWVSFAPANLRSIVYNLLSNAVKYRNPARPAQVWVRAERQPDGVTLSVRDNGLGLDETQQGRLFGVFQRLHTHVEGTGVGLYMIKRLIENAGGGIVVSSRLHVGTTFTVTLPA